jgi:hypothetical protein
VVVQACGRSRPPLGRKGVEIDTRHLEERPGGGGQAVFMPAENEKTPHEAGPLAVLEPQVGYETL